MEAKNPNPDEVGRKQHEIDLELLMAERSLRTEFRNPWLAGQGK